MTTQQPETPPALQQFYDDAAQISVSPGGAPPNLPSWKAEPYMWRWAELEPLITRNGELVQYSRDVQRRILRLSNPGLGDNVSTTHTMLAAIQLLLPGEVAPAHRHSPTAIRWIIEGEGAYTTVEGDKCYMERGDLVLTPAWTWHDHGHEGNGPMIWMDGLDTALVRSLDATFFENYPEDRQPSLGVETNRRQFAAGALKPVWEKRNENWSPLFHYKWDRTYEALQDLAQIGSDPFDDVAMEFTNPTTGGPVLRTMSCWIQMIRPGVHTQAHRQTNSSVYYVHEGQGYTVIDGQLFEWGKGDFITVPSWRWHEHACQGSDPAILFSIQDTPIMVSAGLYREEPYEENGGHQVVTGRF